MNSLDEIIIRSLPEYYRSYFSVFDNDHTKTSSYKLYEEENNIIYKCLAPSMETNDLDIKIDNRVLEIKSKKENENNRHFYVNVNNRLKLSKNIDAEHSFANLEKGILTITMPIAKSSQKTKVKFV